MRLNLDLPLQLMFHLVLDELLLAQHLQCENVFRSSFPGYVSRPEPCGYYYPQSRCKKGMRFSWTRVLIDSHPRFIWSLVGIVTFLLTVEPSDISYGCKNFRRQNKLPIPAQVGPSMNQNENPDEMGRIDAFCVLNGSAFSQFENIMVTYIDMLGCRKAKGKDFPAPRRFPTSISFLVNTQRFVGPWAASGLSSTSFTFIRLY